MREKQKKKKKKKKDVLEISCPERIGRGRKTVGRENLQRCPPKKKTPVHPTSKIGNTPFGSPSIQVLVPFLDFFRYRCSDVDAECMIPLYTLILIP